MGEVFTQEIPFTSLISRVPAVISGPSFMLKEAMGFWAHSLSACYRGKVAKKMR